MHVAPRIDDPIRREQIEEARRLAATEEAPRRTLSVRTGFETRPQTRKPAPSGAKPTLKGHEAFLKALELSGADVELEKCDGTLYRGKVKHSDKYTITIHATHHAKNEIGDDWCSVMNQRDRVIYKHDISEFSALSPRVERTTPDSKTEEGHVV